MTTITNPISNFISSVVNTTSTSSPAPQSDEAANSTSTSPVYDLSQIYTTAHIPGLTAPQQLGQASLAFQEATAILQDLVRDGSLSKLFSILSKLASELNGNLDKIALIEERNQKIVAKNADIETLSSQKTLISDQITSETAVLTTLEAATPQDQTAITNQNNLIADLEMQKTAIDDDLATANLELAELEAEIIVINTFHSLMSSSSSEQNVEIEENFIFQSIVSQTLQEMIEDLNYTEEEAFYDNRLLRNRELENLETRELEDKLELAQNLSESLSLIHQGLGDFLGLVSPSFEQQNASQRLHLSL